ncbi:hypothetical protein NCC49_001003 [Naganishia albida]|nr:hypothetical protein NCC49_001003 [Naganishia albida]
MSNSGVSTPTSARATAYTMTRETRHYQAIRDRGNAQETELHDSLLRVLRAYLMRMYQSKDPWRDVDDLDSRLCVEFIVRYSKGAPLRIMAPESDVAYYFDVEEGSEGETLAANLAYNGLHVYKEYSQGPLFVRLSPGDAWGKPGPLLPRGNDTLNPAKPAL